MSDILSRLAPPPGARTKEKRLGRGVGTGLGKTAGRGQKGQKARHGGDFGKTHFQGGQTPIQRRLPKRGFLNPTRVEYHVVNVGQLAEAAAGTVVDRDWLKSRRIVRRPGPVKLLAGGEIKVALTVKVDAASAAAKKAIESAGGKVETPNPKA